jgi:hypothetical protein
MAAPNLMGQVVAGPAAAPDTARMSVSESSMLPEQAGPVSMLFGEGNWSCRIAAV